MWWRACACDLVVGGVCWVTTYPGEWLCNGDSVCDATMSARMIHLISGVAVVVAVVKTLAVARAAGGGGHARAYGSKWWVARMTAFSLIVVLL